MQQENKSIPQLIEVGEEGRTTIPKDARVALGITGSDTIMIGFEEGEDKDVWTVVSIDDRGRATIPEKIRDYIGMNGEWVGEVRLAKK